MENTYNIDELKDIKIPITSPCLIFLYGDLWAGKTTLSKSILKNHWAVDKEITSPTYVYYNKYWNNYHFDLYRVGDYENFISIGWEEVLDNNTGIILIEWPEILEEFYKPDVKIFLSKIERENERKITVEIL